MRTFACVCLAAFVAAVSYPAAAQQVPCLPRAEWRRVLAERFDEAPVGVGVIGTRSIVEMYVSRDGGTWTLLQVFPGGLACGLASGEDWQVLAQPDTPADPPM